MSSQISGNILIVDDHEINRDLLRLRLELQGFTVEEAATGQEALDRLLGFPSVPYDLVLLDIMMPEISGLDVLRQVRRRYTVADLPIIMATAKDASEDIVEALSLGANDYVTKPIDFAVLFARLDTQLRLRWLSREKDEFIAIASHDLKNPLSVVRGFVKLAIRLLPEGTAMTAEGVDILSRVVRQTVTMENIIRDFLDFQAMEEGQLLLDSAPHDLAALVKEVTDSQAESGRNKSIGVNLVEPNEALTVRCDGMRIQQVVQNLVGNAIKFSPPGRQVEISIRGEGSDAVVEVQDNGPGIPADEHGKLFTKYARLSNRPTGGEKSSGLGLAICKRLIEMHGGAIGAFSNPWGTGTTFWFRLPISD